MKQQRYFNRRKPNPALKARKEMEKMVASSHKVSILLMMTVLHEQCGFGTKRLERFGEEYHQLLEDYNEGRRTIEEMADKLYEETWIKVL